MSESFDPVTQFRPELVVRAENPTVLYALANGNWMRASDRYLALGGDPSDPLPTVLFRDYWSVACRDDGCPLAESLRLLPRVELRDLDEDDDPSPTAQEPRIPRSRSVLFVDLEQFLKRTYDDPVVEVTRCGSAELRVRIEQGPRGPRYFRVKVIEEA